MYVWIEFFVRSLLVYALKSAAWHHVMGDGWYNDIVIEKFICCRFRMMYSDHKNGDVNG